MNASCHPCAIEKVWKKCTHVKFSFLSRYKKSLLKEYYAKLIASDYSLYCNWHLRIISLILKRLRNYLFEISRKLNYCINFVLCKYNRLNLIRRQKKVVVAFIDLIYFLRYQQLKNPTTWYWLYISSIKVRLVYLGGRRFLKSY